VSENLWDWTIFIETDSMTLSSIQCVKYTLHPTFPEPVRTVCSPSNNFGLSTQGWGTFEIKVRVLFKDGTERRLTHQLRFQ
jgi:transcription initiation factor IIF auxiliary subunit